MVAKPLSMIFEKSWQPGEACGEWKNGNTAPISEEGTLRITSLSASPLCLEDHATNLHGHDAKNTQRTGM